jgi:hypothetical protein
LAGSSPQEPLDQGGLAHTLATCRTLCKHGYEGEHWPDLLPRNQWIRVVLPTPYSYLRNTTFCENLRMRISFGRRFPLQEPVDQGGLNQALVRHLGMRIGIGRIFSPGTSGSGWSYPRSSYLQDKIFVKILGHEIGHLTPLSVPGTGGSGWSYPRPCYLQNIVQTLGYEGEHWPDLLSRNRWIRVVFPTLLLPAKHNICENTRV